MQPYQPPQQSWYAPPQPSQQQHWPFSFPAPVVPVRRPYRAACKILSIIFTAIGLVVALFGLGLPALYVLALPLLLAGFILLCCI